ncbi:amino acid adenylation domain-containing protein [Bacillus velezensis]|nr:MULTISPECIES: non-ribosomal peptide synthetase [Bacillus amyloliquefaciens group]MBW8602577.1 amino acid adenylation domain-containing protein [Bacillus amyloliquefaciens]MEE3675558.1 non-ribosomal peptide synthetase [Bacillus velezensis]QBK78389.1 amino acid adenylation domain-containing protein [Bacillus velezensis]QEQ54151.1 amino acid adenylation domain-containing protein [Bacillus amyloliquefaciens]QJW61527.1 amino acid adenylation domain-containing protein [Bacillus amyloliquefaciens]
MNMSSKPVFQSSADEGGFNNRKKTFIIDETCTSMLKAAADQYHITLSALIQTAWGVLLQKYNNVDDVVFGAVISGRQCRVQGIEKMVGLFINAVPLRVKGDGDTVFIALAQKLNSDFIKANTSYGYSSLADIQALTKMKEKLINHMLVYENYPVDDYGKAVDNTTDALRITDMEVFEQTNYDFGLVIIPGRQIKAEMTYNNNVYREDIINRIGVNFCHVLKQVATDPTRVLKDISAVNEEERGMLQEFNKQSSNYTVNKTIQDLFEERAEKTPDQTAAVYAGKHITYKELNEKANQVATLLMEKGAGKNSITAMMIRPSEYSMIGMLGILKTGSAFLPIDDESPVSRINHILKDSKADILITDLCFLADKNIAAECLDITDKSIYTSQNTSNPDVQYDLEDEVYVIYTSGTSGKPKGVKVKNKSLVNYSLWVCDQININSDSRSLVTSKYSFDLCYTSIFPVLSGGGQVHFVDKEVYLHSLSLIEYIHKNSITYLKMTPTLFSTLMEDVDMLASCPDLKVIILGGESINIGNVKKLAEKCRWMKFINHYGPTESTVGCIAHSIDLDHIQNCEIYNRIGRPIHGINIYIVDRSDQLVPVGAPGEICISGVGLASGYVNNEELTNEKFIDNPFHRGAKMYKTGDLGRWMPDGNIEFLGRIDNQIKIRGFRVEIGEIENQLLQLEGIKEAAVIYIEEKYLSAYITGDIEMEGSFVQEKLAQVLPKYMIPSFIIQLKELPLTANGKINRKELPLPDLQRLSVPQYEAPANETEEKLAEIWKEMLGHKRISINEDFFELGGHSLTAAFTISRIRKTFGTDIKVKELFEQPTIKQLSRLIQKRDKQNYPVISKARKQSSYQASSAQKRMFALWETDKDSIVYNLPIMIELNGKLDVKKAESVLQEIIGRHEALRTSFDVVSGDVVQIIHDTWELEFNYQKLPSDGIRPYVKQFIRPFHLDKAPLIRAGLITYEDRNLLLLDVHHIAADGVSVGIIRKEFNALYAGHKLKQPPLQYKDYSEWQVSSGTKEALKEQEEYWLKRLSGDLPILNLQTDYERPRVKSFEGSRVSFTADERLTSSLKSVAKETGTTLYMVLLAVYNVMLSKYSGQQDVIIGTAESGRSDTELENTVGMFVNTVAIRNFPEEHKTFRAFLEEVKHHTLKDFENTDYQFENIVQKLGVKRDSSRNPLFDVMFVLENADYGIENHLDPNPEEHIQTEINISKFDLTLTATEIDNGIKFHLEYSSQLFEKETAERMGAHFTKLLQSAAAGLDQPLMKLDLIPEQEKHTLLHIFNDTAAEFPWNKTIHQLFEEQAEKTPERIAAVQEDTLLTYKELNEKSNSLANLLRQKGIRENSIVGIMTERSLEMIIGIIGVLKAGGAYLPIDPEYPDERVNYMLKDSDANILLIQNGLSGGITFNKEILSLSDPALYMHNRSNLPNVSCPEDLAYMIYTSGTTGLPKGVMVKHKGVVNYIHWANKIYVNDEDIDFPLYSSISFDLTVTSIYTPLISGNKIIIYEGPDKALLIRRIIEENKADIIKLTPTHLRLLENVDLSTSKIKKIIVGGEELKTGLAKKIHGAFNGHVKIYNEYGPTEATVGCMIHQYHIERDNGNAVSIGKPADNTKLYILGKQLELLPLGAAGELCVSGEGLADGYKNKAGLTSEKFVDNPFEPGAKLYRTGDMAKWMPDGTIDYLGRIDDQVKIRGYRIETGEIENRLLKMSHIREAVVVARDDQHGDKYLCGYVTSDKKIDVYALKENLSKELPLYMVPSYIFQIEKMPLSSNGKIDTKSLPIIDIADVLESAYEAPRNKKEQILACVWEKVLGMKSIGINYNYYEIGGDSIKSILVVSELQKYGLKLEVRDLMKYPHIKDLSAHVKSADIQADQSIVEGDVDLTPIQKWFIEQRFEQENHYNQAFMLYKKSGIEEKAIETAFLELVRHHDALRMQFKKENGEIKQWNRGIKQAKETFTLEVFDMTQTEDPAMAIESLADRMQNELSLEKGILIKLAVFKTKNGDHLLLTIHHMIIDGVSWRILLEDFETAYLQTVNGNKVELETKTASFKEWARQLKEYANSKALQKEAGYWETIETAIIEPLPKDFIAESCSYEDSKEIKIELTEDQTKTLLRNTNAAYHTQINDILLCSLGLAAKEWTGNEKILVNLEGHGRESVIKTPVHRTIGWFTTIYPIVLDMTERNSLSSSIKYTKEMLRHIPHNGIGYGILRYLSDSVHLQLKPDISFNYLGEFGQEDRSNLFQISPLSAGTSISGRNKKTHSIEINGYIMDGRLMFTFNYSANQYKRETIEQFTKAYQLKINQIIEHCVNKKISEKTPWDYGDPDLQIEELNQILASGAEVEKIHSLSPMQEGMLYNAVIDHQSSAYFEQSEITVEGNLNTEVLSDALNRLIAKYEILRTSFFYNGFRVFKQAILKERKLNIQYHDISQWEEQKKDAFVGQFKVRDRNTPFDLNKDCLIRVSVIKLGRNKFKVIYSFHHIILDGWSVGILLKELMDLYGDVAEGKKLLQESPVPYSRYLEWLDQQDKDRAFEYWKEYLSAYEQEISFPELELKSDEYQHDQKLGALNGETAAKLKKIAESNSITLNSIVQTAWGILLQKYNNTNDVVFGSIVSGRPSEINGIENMVGLFINAVPIRVKRECDTSFISLAKQINKDFIEANEYSYCSLADIQSLTSMKNKLINHVVVYENYPLSEDLFQDSARSSVKITAEHGFEQTNYDLELLIAPGDDLHMKITYNASVYSKETVSSILDNLVSILQQAAADHEVIVSQIDMVNETEKQKLVKEFNCTELSYKKEKTLQELFEEQALRTPDAIALEWNGDFLTYKELNNKANQLARALRENGIKENVVVPILVRRSFRLIIGILGILKAGGCYLPLDPDYPADRINYMLKDSKSGLLLTEEGLPNELTYSGTIFNIDSEDLLHQLETNIDVINRAEDLAYVIYTSGSTGKPKGVAVEHRAVHNFIKGITDRISFSQDNVLLSVTTCSFDIFGLESLLPLTQGLKVVIAGEAEQRDPYLLNKIVVETDVNTIQLTPSRLKLMLSAENSTESLQKLKTIMVGGEVFQRELLFELKKYKNLKIYNMYGPTETTIWSSVKDLTNENSVNIGKPIANTQIYIVDHDGNTVPLGSTGELCIAGAGMARGYLGKEDLTAQKFVDNPFVKGTKMYKTGDLARWLPNGELDVIGRMDNQVKIRGYRIELGEIESIVNQHEKVKECVAAGKTNSAGVQDLVLYYVAESTVYPSEFIKLLSPVLPEYMIPQIFMKIDQIPLTANGKINVLALPEPVIDRTGFDRPFEEAVTDVQKSISRVWTDVLKIEEPGIHDNFFEAGGNSIKIVAVYNELQKLYPKQIQIADLFAYPTIYRLSEYIESAIAFAEIAVSLEKEIIPITLPLEYISESTGQSHTAMHEYAVNANYYDGLKTICNTYKYDISHVLLAGYVFLLADVSQQNLVHIQFSGHGDDRMSQLSFDLSDIENFHDIIRMAKEQIENQEDSQYDLNTHYKKSSSAQDVFPLFYISNESKKEYSELYDLVFAVHEKPSEAEIVFIYNHQKLNEHKMKDLFYNYMNLIQVITADKADNSI